MNQDRNLLFGVLAVQMGKVTPAQLTEIAASWMSDPSRPLDERFLSSHLISEKDHKLLLAFVEQAVQLNEGDPKQTLASIANEESVRRTLGPELSHAFGMSTPTVPGLPPEFEMSNPKGLESWPAVQESPGRYSHATEYAKGGMGRVLLVYDQHIGRDVALKELVPDYDGETLHWDEAGKRHQPFMGRFLQEARITGQLEHPCIVPVYELGVRSDGNLYYTMKLVRGRTLRRAIEQARSLSERLALLPNYLDLCHALAYAHSRGVVHRDLKPQNVMVGAFGETVVLDWGLAKAKHHDDVIASEMRETVKTLKLGELSLVNTAIGRAFGTPQYMPPEQARGEIDLVNHRSDVYSLGAILYEILTGKPPVDGDSVQEILDKVVNESPAPVASLVPEAPPELVAICEHAMEKDAALRYSSAQELADDIRRFLAGALVEVYRYSSWEHLKRYARRHKPELLTAGAAAVVIAGMVIFSFLRIRAERDTAREALTAAQVQSYRSSIVLARQGVEERNFDLARSALAMAPQEMRHWEWSYYDRLCRSEAVLLDGNGGAVEGVAFSRDGLSVATAHEDHRVRLWNAVSGSLLKVFEGHSGHVTGVTFNPDGAKLLSWSDDGTARLWDTTSDKPMGVLLHQLGVGYGAFNRTGDRVLTVSGVDDVALWSMVDGSQVAVLAAEANNVSPRMSPVAHFAPDGTSVLVLGHHVRLYDAVDGSIRREYEAQGRSAVAAGFDARGERLALAWDDGTASVVTFPAGEPLASFTWRDALDGDDGSSMAMVFTEGGERLITASWKGFVRVWSSSTGKEELRLQRFPMPLRSVMVRPESRQFLTLCDDRTAQLWSAETGDLLATFTGHSLHLTDAAFSPDGVRAVTASSDGTARIWDAESSPSAEVARFRGHTRPLRAVASSPSATFFATAASDGTVKVWDVRSGKLLCDFGGHDGPVLALAFTEDGQTLVSGADDGLAMMWNVETSEFIRPLVGHTDSVTSVAVARSGNTVYTGAGNGEIRFWNGKDGTLKASVKAHGRRINAMALNREESRLLTASEDGTAALWDTRTGQEFARLKGHTGAVEDAAFSPDGRLAATASRDATARLWSVDDGRCVAVLTGHSRMLTSLAFSPDGAWLATASADFHGMVWNMANFRSHFILEGHTSHLAGIHFSMDGRRLITASSDGTAAVWDMDTGTQLARLSGHAGPLIDALFVDHDTRVLTASMDGTACLWAGKREERELANTK